MLNMLVYNISYNICIQLKSTSLTNIHMNLNIKY